MEESDSYGAMRELSHQNHYLLWQKAKLGSSLEGEDARLVQVMREHPQYYEVWEHAMEYGQELVTIDGVNPFMHVTMHLAVENQLAADDPPEVRAVLEYRISHHTPRHHAVHEIAAIFLPMMHETLRDKTPFDNDAYRRKLRRLVSHPRRKHR
jgi:hypothetical protein